MSSFSKPHNEKKKTKKQLELDFPNYATNLN